MSLRNNLKLFRKEIKTLFNIEFDKTSADMLHEEALKAYKHNDEIASYKLDIASDIKNLMFDRSLDRQDSNFYIENLLIFFFKE